MITGPDWRCIAESEAERFASDLEDEEPHECGTISTHPELGLLLRSKSYHTITRTHRHYIYS
jgi:hypothetical protein